MAGIAGMAAVSNGASRRPFPGCLVGSAFCDSPSFVVVVLFVAIVVKM
jgi:hypothetical protein